MAPEISIKDFYNYFINNTESDLLSYKESLEKDKKLLDDYKLFLLNNKDKILNKFGLNLNDFCEFKDNKIEDKFKLLNKAVKLSISFDENKEDIELINCIILYCKTLNKVLTKEKLIESNSLRENVDFVKYKDLVKKYYTKVNDLLVEGKGIRIDNGFGIVTIEYIPKDINNKFKKIDMYATRKRKQELLDKGIKLYNAQEAEEYRKAGLPYDGVSPIVYSENGFLLYPMVLNSVGFYGNSLRFYPINYVAKELKGYSYEELANNFSSEKLSKRRLYLITRINVELKRNPLNYLKYIHRMKNNV